MVSTFGSILGVFSILLVCLCAFYFYLKTSYNYYKKKGVPYDIPKFFFGSFFEMVQLKKSIISPILAEIYLKHTKQKFIGFFTFWRKDILIMNLEMIKSILVKDFDIFSDRDLFYNKKKDPLSAHLFALDGQEWKHIRSKMSPTFSSGKIKYMFDNIIQCSNQMVEYVSEVRPKTKMMECQNLFSKFGLSVISSTAFGLESDVFTNDDSMLLNMAQKTLNPTLSRLFASFLSLNKRFATLLNARIVPKDVADFFMTLVNDMISLRKDNNIERKDFLQILIQMKENGLPDKNGTSTELTDDEVAAEAFVFILAGLETTSSLMSFCLYELSLNPEAQQRLLTELDLLTNLTYDTVNSLEYLDMVIDETLRKYPPLGFLNRACNKDYLLPGTNFVIEKGTQVFVSVQGLHHDPELFPQPELFLPERFSKKNRMNIKPFSYLPFGDGPRFCIGKRYAKTTVKTGLAALLRRYRVVPPPSTIPLVLEPLTLLTKVQGGLWVCLEDRTPRDNIY